MESHNPQPRAFFSRTPADVRRPDGSGIGFLTLPGGEDWLLRPVARGWIRYESLYDTTLDLFDIALMNDAIDVEAENQRRYDAAMRPKR